MIWKRYQNELVALLAFVVMIGAYLYKNSKINEQAEYAVTVKHSIEEMREIIALQKIWADKKTSKKVAKLQSLVPSSKVKWSKKKKKVTAVYDGLSAKEMTKLTTKILNLAVEIQQFEVEKTDSTYHVEFKCKW